MAVNPTKTVTLDEGESQTVFFKNGYPRCGAMRADVTSEVVNDVNVDFGISTDDDVKDKSYDTDFDTVHQAQISSGDNYTGAGTTAMGRSVAIKVEHTSTDDATDQDPIDVELTLSNTSDPAQNDHGFAYKNTYRESDRK